jgi:predicted XRE-type DNA-binding protein
VNHLTSSEFTIDRLMVNLARLGQEVELSVSVHPRTIRDAAADSRHRVP